MARYIDADLLVEHIRELENLGLTRVSLNSIRRTVRDAPTANVVEVHGEYVNKEKLYCDTKCHKCGKSSKLLFGILPDYCPYCGTKLNEDVEDIKETDSKSIKCGEWLYNPNRVRSESPYFCSLCISGGSNEGTDNYCPNCGVKMKRRKR